MGRMRQVADDIHVLGTWGHNFYLIIEDGEATLIDAGCSGEWGKLSAALDAIDVPIESVRTALITHTHADHFGLADRLRSRGIEVAVHEDEHARASGSYTGRFAVTPGELPLFRLRTMRVFLPMVRAGVMKLVHTADVTTFTDGHRFDVPGRPTAIHVPGHTEGHVMYLCADRGVLFTGDGLVTIDLIGPSSGPQVLDRRFNLDHDQTIASLDRIVDVDADLLLPGHGHPWHGSPDHAVALVRSSPAA